MKASIELSYETTGKEEIKEFESIEKAIRFMDDELEISINDPLAGGWEFEFMGCDEGVAYFNGYYSK